MVYAMMERGMKVRLAHPHSFVYCGFMFHFHRPSSTMNLLPHLFLFQSIHFLFHGNKKRIINDKMVGMIQSLNLQRVTSSS